MTALCLADNEVVILVKMTQLICCLVSSFYISTCGKPYDLIQNLTTLCSEKKSMLSKESLPKDFIEQETG